jgi:hypothetical protein
MTWRTTLYLLTVLLAAVAVATTGLSESGPSGVESTSPSAIIATATLAEHARRMVMLVVGAVMVIVTYRRAYSNLRSQA